MKTLKVLSFVVAAALCISVALVLSRPVKSDTPNSASVIDGYKNWTHVNPEPKLVPAQVAALCAPVTARNSGLDQTSPHRDKFVVVYVNDVGRTAMMEKLSPTFPQGSLIVKEKLATRDSNTPELLTVMRKREAGYDPERGDWEYLVFNGAGTTIQESGKLQKCQECHVREKATDYVSRDYMPAEVWKKLK
jgi:hypothetical protein